MAPVVRAVRAFFERAGVVVRLTGHSFWRGFLGFYNSDDLTYAASIAYYALLSLFPFFLLALAMLAHVTADVQDRAAVMEFVLQYFPLNSSSSRTNSTRSATPRSASASPAQRL